ncbi:MAG: tricarboxylate binding receptor [Deltaproteobacteria bacterium]|jgi:tripartite-type tricarboxylate transporter receptor subunit TctC|nr:tricarboxylate binding receptor [Deltaproteobacteria bacterium]
MKAKALSLVVILFVVGFGIQMPLVSFAQKYPDRPIQLVVPNAAGSLADITARMVASELEKAIGTKIIANNKPGAAQVLGTDFVIRGKKDGYTLLYTGSSPLIYAPITNPEIVHYDPGKDLEPLGLHYLSCPSFNVRADAPWKTFPEIIDFAKKNPGKLRVATSGVGHPTHFMLEVIQAVTGAQFTHVPFEGGETVTTAVLGGHVEASCDAYSKQKPLAEAGKMRVLLITYKMPSAPQIPTITEFGYKQELPSSWFALFAASGIPEDAKKVLVPAIEKAVKDTKPKIDNMGGVLAYKSPAEFRKMWEVEYKQISEIAAKIGMGKK